MRATSQSPIAGFDETGFRALFEHSPDGVIVSRPDGTILRANPAACRMLGRTEDELRASGRAGVVEDDHRLQRYLVERARSGTAHAEMLHRRPDGTVFPLDVTSALVPSGDGEPHAIVVLRDLSARRAEEEVLRRYELLASHSRDAMLFVRREDGRILEANAAASTLYGFTREELLARTVMDLRAPAARTDAAGQMATADAVGVLFETVHQRKDGGTFPVEVSSQGANIGVCRVLVSVIRDITVRRRAEDALRESDRRKSEFLALLSHELRNPLAPILNGVALLGRARLGPEAERARVVVERQARHLARLVDDLLDLTRVTRGKIELERELLDVCDLLRRAAEDHRDTFAQRGIALHLELPDAPLWIDADPTRVAQAVGNLLQNASRFTHDGGTTMLSARRAGDAAELAVRDDGIGIEPELLGRLFEPFVQAERTLARSAGGLGLGLALVKGLVELHGGSVRARSDGHGRGATFELTFPAAPEPARDAASPSRPPTAARPRRVLVVEDNVDAAESLAELLRLDGHEVEIAPDGRSGLDRARAFAPEVVLCDLGLPDLSGYDVARALRAEPTLAGARLVAVSGYAQWEDRARALEAGFDAHVAKPVPLEELAALLV
jgi:PAS domain S-box-containing protein